MSTALASVGDRTTLKTMMEAMRDSIADVIPKHLTPERMMKMALVAASRQPKLFECTRESFLQSIMRASELGLDCSGTLGSGYLVPFYNSKIGAREVVFIPGYRGLIDLARRSGQIAGIEAHCVYQNDGFDIEYGTAKRLIHKPTLDTEPGPMKCVYAIARIKDQDDPQIEVMTRTQVDRIRKASKAGDSGPWVDHYDEMARKTVVRRLCKYLPLSPELEQAFSIEDEIDRRPEYTQSVVNDVQVAGTRTEQLEKKLTERKTEPPSAPVGELSGDVIMTPAEPEAEAPDDGLVGPGEPQPPSPPKAKAKGKSTKAEKKSPNIPEDVDMGALRLNCKTLFGKLGYANPVLTKILEEVCLSIDEDGTVTGLNDFTVNALTEMKGRLERAIGEATT